MDNLSLRAARIRLYNLIGSVAIAILIAVGITAGAFVLSFSVLEDLARQAQMPLDKAFLFPLIVDGAILGATVGTIVLSKIDGSDTGKRFFLFLLVAVVWISVIGNAYHAYMAAQKAAVKFAADGAGVMPLTPTAAAVIATIPPLLVLAFTHGIGLLIRAIGAAYSEYNDALRAVERGEQVSVAEVSETLVPESGFVAPHAAQEQQPVLWDGADFVDEVAPRYGEEPVAEYATAPRSGRAPKYWDRPQVNAAAEPAVPVFAPESVVAEKDPSWTEGLVGDPVVTPVVHEPTPEPVVAPVVHEPTPEPVVTAPEPEAPVEAVFEPDAEAVVAEPELSPSPAEAVSVEAPVHTETAAESFMDGPLAVEAEMDVETPTVDDLLAFFETADIHEGDKTVARLKTLNPEMSFEEIANRVGSAGPDFVLRKYRRAEAAALNAGFTWPPLLPVTDDATRNEMASAT
ncbi:DUF2637 domain-containing protein [Rhodococcus qingshengii]|uniref:DUF2637 domain-containing protein n=1 Tax=Rhodococcus qingshengii TaxID=334542 RepID=UPI001F1387E7|nr:DUF2637 domain-containing protein [Rhodococcus qingshengii]ULD38966.1 DUF2637 domain-containing protein [Rhodococcus qingshengii]